MKKALIIGSIAMCIPAIASADFIGFRIGASAWNQNYEGTVQSGPDTLDVENVLGLDSETNNSFYVAFEHPVPLIPNVKLARTEMDTEEENTISEGFIFDDTPFSANSLVRTVSDLSHTDLTLYYEVLDNWVSLDLGITVRQFDEGISLSYRLQEDGLSVSASEKIDDVLPMLYAAAKFDLPFTGLYAGGDVNAVSYDGDSLFDYKINIGYETSLGFGAEVGFRSFELDYEDSRTEKADITVDGGYASIFYHF
jgi:outer membrane protein